MFETNRLMILAGDTGKNWGLHEAEYCPLSSGLLFIRILTTTHRHLLQTIHLTNWTFIIETWTLYIVCLIMMWKYTRTDEDTLFLVASLLAPSSESPESVSKCIYLLMLLKSEGHWCDWQLMFAPRWRYIASINSFTQHRVFNLSLNRNESQRLFHFWQSIHQNAL